MAWHQLRRVLLGLLTAAALCTGASGVLGANLAVRRTFRADLDASRRSSRRVTGHLQRSEVTAVTDAVCRPPLLVAVGASYTDGVGAQRRFEAWPYQLARLLHWRVVARGVPGAGYIRTGWDGGGPLSREVAELDLRRLHPSLVIIQSGHNDIGEPLPLLRQRVKQLIETVRDETPRSVLALITVFIRAGHRPTAAAWATDRTIVDSARQADPRTLVFDPLAGHWHYPRPTDHLHPRAAGYQWIARRLDDRLRRDGVLDRAGNCSAVADRGVRRPERGEWGASLS